LLCTTKGSRFLNYFVGYKVLSLQGKGTIVNVLSFSEKVVEPISNHLNPL